MKIILFFSLGCCETRWEDTVCERKRGWKEREWEREREKHIFILFWWRAIHCHQNSFHSAMPKEYWRPDFLSPSLSIGIKRATERRDWRDVETNIGKTMKVIERYIFRDTKRDCDRKREREREKATQRDRDTERQRRLNERNTLAMTQACTPWRHTAVVFYRIWTIFTVTRNVPT